MNQWVFKFYWMSTNVRQCVTFNVVIIFNHLYSSQPTKFMVTHRNTSTWCSWHTMFSAGMNQKWGKPALYPKEMHETSIQFGKHASSPIFLTSAHSAITTWHPLIYKKHLVMTMKQNEKCSFLGNRMHCYYGTCHSKSSHDYIQWILILMLSKVQSPKCLSTAHCWPTSHQFLTFWPLSYIILW